MPEIRAIFGDPDIGQTPWPAVPSVSNFFGRSRFVNTLSVGCLLK
jgi:hypothetical protein